MDWQRFLDENNIHYVSRGPNTKRGEVSIKCPMCGDEDPSEHLGINLQTGQWGCHRDSSHRGKSSRTLVKAILCCSSSQAQHIIRQYSVADPDTLEAALNMLSGEPGLELFKQVRQQHLDPQFDDFNKIKMYGVTKRFYDYLRDRTPDDTVTTTLIGRHDLRCALVGRYQDRIIIPVRMNNELLGWTARAIVNPKHAPRYLASSEDVKATIFDYDHIKEGGDALFITEGPFDAMRLNHTNIDENWHIRATCTFGTSVTLPQIALLRAVAQKYERVWVLFDQGADGPSQELAGWLNTRSAYLPTHIKDPGELDERNLGWAWCRGYDGFFSDYGAFKHLSNLWQPPPVSKHRP